MHPPQIPESRHVQDIFLLHLQIFLLPDSEGFLKIFDHSFLDFVHFGAPQVLRMDRVVIDRQFSFVPPLLPQQVPVEQGLQDKNENQRNEHHDLGAEGLEVLAVPQLGVVLVYVPSVFRRALEKHAKHNTLIIHNLSHPREGKQDYENDH